MRRGQSYRIAQCSMVTALAVIVLVFGYSLGIGEFFWYYVASVLVDLPERIADKFLCFVSATILATVLCGFNFIYLAAFCLLIAPYSLTKAIVRNKPQVVQYLVITMIVFCGLSAVCWWTPMFFIQLNTKQTPSLLWMATAFMAIVSLGFEPLYGRAHRFGKQILLKVWFRIA